MQASRAWRSNRIPTHRRRWPASARTPRPARAPDRGDAPAGEESPRRSWRDGPFRVHMPVDVRSVSLTIIAGAAILGVLQLAQPVIIPFVVSGLLFYALDPAVDWLQRWKMPRALGAALVLLLAIGGIGAGGYALSRRRHVGGQSAAAKACASCAPNCAGPHRSRPRSTRCSRRRGRSIRPRPTRRRRRRRRRA